MWNDPAGLGERSCLRGIQFKYLGIKFRCDGMVERHIGTVSAAMQALYQIAVVKRELSRKAKLLICQTHVRSKPHLWS